MKTKIKKMSMPLIVAFILFATSTPISSNLALADSTPSLTKLATSKPALSCPPLEIEALDASYSGQVPIIVKSAYCSCAEDTYYKIIVGRQSDHSVIGYIDVYDNCEYYIQNSFFCCAGCDDYEVIVQARSTIDNHLIASSGTYYFYWCGLCSC
jgi:hypothetical protein